MFLSKRTATSGNEIVHISSWELIFFLREELIKYYDELSREMEHREFRAEWLVRRRLLNSARAQLLAQEQAQWESLMDQLTPASSLQAAAKKADEGIAQLGKEEEKSPFVEKEEKLSTPASALKPSLVSLIASGVKTDAFLRAEQGMNTSVAGTSHVAEPEGRVSDGNDKAQDEKYSVEATSSSKIGIAEGRFRKTWNNPDASAAELEKFPEAGSGRKTWEAPPDGEVKIASVTPKSHPSDSSVQFAIYSGKQMSGKKEVKPESNARADALKTYTSRTADSSLQNILYPSATSDKPGLDTQSSSIATRPSGSEAGGLFTGHPSDSSAQYVLYSHVTEAASEVRTPSLEGHPSDSSAQQLLYGSSVQELANTETVSTEHGHPSDSSVSHLLYPTILDTPTPQPPRLNQHGHPSDSQVSLSCGDSHELNVAQVIQHSSRSTWQHPSDSSVQTLLGNITLLGESQTTTRRTPPRSVAQDILYPSLDEQSTSVVSHARGIPPQSVAQDILYPREEESWQGPGISHTRGAPPSSVIQDIMYPSGEGTEAQKPEVSTRGHEPAVKITNIMYYVKEEKGEIE